MKRPSERTRAAALAALLLAGLAAGTPAMAEEGEQAEVVHMVVMWFTQPVSAEKLRQVVEITRSFRDIPGVVEVRAGESLQLAARNIDTSFSVGLYIVFENQAALEAYENDAVHVAAKQSGALDGLARMVVYNFADQ